MTVIRSLCLSCKHTYSSGKSHPGSNKHTSLEKCNKRHSTGTWHTHTITPTAELILLVDNKRFLCLFMYTHFCLSTSHFKFFHAQLLDAMTVILTSIKFTLPCIYTQVDYRLLVCCVANMSHCSGLDVYLHTLS